MQWHVSWRLWDLAGVLRVKGPRIARKAVAAGDRVNRRSWQNDPDQLWVDLLTSLFGRASSMWRLSLMCLPDTSWVAGLIVYGNDIRAGYAGAGVVGRRRLAPSITAIKALSMCHWPIRATKRSRITGINRSTGDSATTRWLRASMGLYKAGNTP